jgi:hypothetical protein
VRSWRWASGTPEKCRRLAPRKRTATNP